jgi:hypothetical protein
LGRDSGITRAIYNAWDTPGVMGGLGKFNLHIGEVVQIDFKTHPRRDLNGPIIPNNSIVKVLRELDVDNYRLFVQIEF